MLRMAGTDKADNEKVKGRKCCNNLRLDGIMAGCRLSCRKFRLHRIETSGIVFCMNHLMFCLAAAF